MNIENLTNSTHLSLRKPSSKPRNLPPLSTKASTTCSSYNYELDMLLNARKRHCRKIWTSYGITMITLPFLGGLGQVELQKLNRFFYNTAICRVQVSIITDSVFCYLTDSYKNNLMSYQSHLRISAVIKHSYVDFMGVTTVQGEGETVYGLNTSKGEFGLYQGFRTRIEYETKARPIFNRTWPALANFENKLIFCVGGNAHGKGSNNLT